MSTNHSTSDMHEVVTRMRRIETRLTTFMVSQGVEINAQPRWRKTAEDDGHVEVNALSASLSACMAAVPKDHPFEDVDVRHNGELVAVLYVGRATA